MEAVRPSKPGYTALHPKTQSWMPEPHIRPTFILKFLYFCTCTDALVRSEPGVDNNGFWCIPPFRRARACPLFAYLCTAHEETNINMQKQNYNYATGHILIKFLLTQENSKFTRYILHRAAISSLSVSYIKPNWKVFNITAEALFTVSQLHNMSIPKFWAPTEPRFVFLPQLVCQSYHINLLKSFKSYR